MKEVILIKNGELALKGLNRRTFEDILCKNMRRRLAPLGKFQFMNAQSTIVVSSAEDVDMQQAFSHLCQVFGIAGLSRAAAVEKDMDVILQTAGVYLSDELHAAQTFKVEAKRADKRFALTSPEICRELGARLLTQFPHLRVDVHNPDVVVMVEVRDHAAYIHGNQHKGAGGMPVGSSGTAALLVSGGIDSPVAGWMMAKRGLSLVGIHFASPPYTGPRAEQKVHSLLQKVARYSGRIALYVVPFTKIQEQIKEHCPEDIFTVVMRRMMVRISQLIARRENCGALITGESVAQVASQTLDAIACTNAVADMPVLRPLIGMDKEEVIAIARKIDTFDISILPYEDCCTVFTPKHPRTKPKLAYVANSEAALDMQPLIQEAAEQAKRTIILP